jgi:hypothetical protein
MSKTHEKEISVLQNNIGKRVRGSVILNENGTFDFRPYNITDEKREQERRQRYEIKISDYFNSGERRLFS